MGWKTAYLETRVLSATPVELVGILYEYATLNVQNARSALAEGNIEVRSRSVLKAIAILGELESSLDHRLGGEIAYNLGRLYRYMREKLTLANFQQADKPLAEAEALLKTLGEAWQAIAPNKGTAVDDAAYERNALREWNAFPMMESMPDYSAHTWSA